MSSHQLFVKTSLMFVIAALLLALANAKPSHFADSNQLAAGEQEGGLLEPELKPWQLEQLAQRIVELSQLQQPSGDPFGFQRALRSQESKRQSRYRQCYFNPISCFRK